MMRNAVDVGVPLALKDGPGDEPLPSQEEDGRQRQDEGGRDDGKGGDHPEEALPGEVGASDGKGKEVPDRRPGNRHQRPQDQAVVDRAPLEGLVQEIQIDVEAEAAVLHHAHLEDLEERVDDEEEEAGRDHGDGRGQHRFPKDLPQVTHRRACSDQRAEFSVVTPQTPRSPPGARGSIAEG